MYLYLVIVGGMTLLLFASVVLHWPYSTVELEAHRSRIKKAANTHSLGFKGIRTLHRRTTAAIMFASSRRHLVTMMPSQARDCAQVSGLRCAAAPVYTYEINTPTLRPRNPRRWKPALEPNHKDSPNRPHHGQHNNPIRKACLIRAFGHPLNEEAHAQHTEPQR